MRSFSSNEFKKPKPSGGGAPKRAGENLNVGSSVSGTKLLITPPFGQYDGVNAKVSIDDADFISGNIKDGINLFGITGTFRNFSAGNNQLIYRGGESTGSTTPVKIAEFSINGSGIYRVKFGLRSDSDTTYGQIYRNGSPVGTLRSVHHTTGSLDFTEDIYFAAGDKCQIYGYHSGGWCYMLYFYLYAAEAPTLSY